MAILISIGLWIAERLGWAWLSGLLTAMKPKPPPADPTPVAQAHDLGVAQTSLQSEETSDATAEKMAAAKDAVAARQLGDPDSLRDPSPYSRD